MQLPYRRQGRLNNKGAKARSGRGAGMVYEGGRRFHSVLFSFIQFRKKLYNPPPLLYNKCTSFVQVSGRGPEGSDLAAVRKIERLNELLS